MKTIFYSLNAILTFLWTIGRMLDWIVNFTAAVKLKLDCSLGHLEIFIISVDNLKF